MIDIYHIIQKPCLTEKGMALQEKHNQVVMKVNAKANKIQIKSAVEHLFKVKVNKVRTANLLGKKKRVGIHFGQRSDWKKAVITLAEGHKIDFLEQL